MTKKIKGDLILKERTIFEESIEVSGDIRGDFDLKVIGNIYARNIYARNIYARNIYAWDIYTENIYAWNIYVGDIYAWDIKAENIYAENIYAGNIYARDIICETRKKKSENAETICRVYVKNKSKLRRKEQEAGLVEK